MKSYLLEVENDVEANLINFFMLLPKDKVKITVLEKKEVLENVEKPAKLSPWGMLRNVNIDAPSDSSVEHDHYIRGSEKISK